VTTLGIIGSGYIGAAVARLAVAAGIDVVIANSRGPATLTELVEELGPQATAGTVEEAAQAGELVLLSIPFNAVRSMPPDVLAGKIVLDTSNYYPSRDGRIAELDTNALTTSEYVQRHFAAARLVKAFNSILAHHIPQLARPSGAPDRSALPVAGDDAEAKTRAAALLDQLGFDTVDAGSAAESWRIEPESAPYFRIYHQDPTTPSEEMGEAPSAPVSADVLRQAIATTSRVNVAARPV